MSSKSKRVTTIIALLLVFATSQAYVGVSFAVPGPNSAGAEGAFEPQQPAGILTTQGNKAVSVNGATAITGATILSGASIETPDGVGGTVNLGALGWVEISPNTKLTLEFEQGKIKIMLTEGCFVLHAKKGTAGEVDTSLGVAGKTESDKDAVISICFPKGATAPVVNGGGSVATAGAAAAGKGGLFGLGTAASVAIIGGAGAAATIIPLALRGSNPSP
jgi:hypothetical protein